MANNKTRKKKKVARPDTDFLASARKLAAIVPSLKKFKKRKTVTRNEKRRIRYREKQLKNIPFLVPVTKAQAKKLGRKKLFLPGIQAVQLRNVPEGSKISIKKRGDVSVVTPSGQRWIYWGLSRDTVRSRRGMREAGRQVFSHEFPIEKVTELTAKAFAQYKIQQVHLWAHAGIVGDGFADLQQFIQWVNEKWQNGRYITVRQRSTSGDIYSEPSDPGKWVNGIAILIENPEYTKRRKALQKANKQ
jgi:hypothetical protein